MSAQTEPSLEDSATAGRLVARRIWLALGLSLGAAMSLGVARFAYGLLLPAMRDDLAWSYALAGAMNTANAAGYLVGALSTPVLIRRIGPDRVVWAGAVATTLTLALSGTFIATPALLFWRLVAGVGSAWLFVTGGLLAARLAERQPAHGGLLIGLYYGGTGFGIVLSALLVPAVQSAMAARPHAWTWSWWWLATVCVPASVVLVLTTRALNRDATRASAQGAASGAAPSTQPPASGGPRDADAPSLWSLGWAIAGYACFGAGYIGYMTFVIALLGEQGAGSARLTAFYALLGLTCIASSRLWARLLDRWRGGQALALLCALVGVATILPVLTSNAAVAMLSGALFGAVFLSVVASTTALVRHNLPAERWAAGISAFTITFAGGQILGPVVVGWLSDGQGGLARGLVASAIALWIGAALALRQRPLPRPNAGQAVSS